MKKEYDFSKAEKGKFYRPNATFAAQESKIKISELINIILIKEMEIHNSLYSKK